MCTVYNACEHEGPQRRKADDGLTRGEARREQKKTESIERLTVYAEYDCGLEEEMAVLGRARELVNHAAACTGGRAIYLES